MDCNLVKVDLFKMVTVQRNIATTESKISFFATTKKTDVAISNCILVILTGFL